MDGGAPLLLIGVDEAGYGPLLGPLCVGATAMRVRGFPAEHAWDFDPRRVLEGLITGPSGPRREAPLPVPVGDSKAIRTRYGAAGLARGVGALASALGTPPPADLADLLRRFSLRMPEDFTARPWYQALEEEPVPRYPWTGPLDTTFAERGIEAVDLRVQCHDAGELNGLFAFHGNKAPVLALMIGTLVAGLLDDHPDADVLLTVDRLGGRKDYRGILAAWFPMGRVTVLDSPPQEVRYLVELLGRRLQVAFVTQGDARSLLIGWASMAAKLTRDLFVHRLNAWFAARRPGLLPTSGYVQDGRRFLQDVEDVLLAEDIDLRTLVRER